MKKIKKVADILKFLAKEQGLTKLSYKRLSLVINNAQMSLWGELRKKFERTQEITDDIRPWIEIASTTTTDSVGKFTLPSDYGHLSGLYYSEDETEVDIVKEGESSGRINSELIPLSSSKPMGVFRGSYIQFYPKQAYSSVMLVYLRYPVDAAIDYTVSNNRETYVDTTTVDLECTEASLDEIIRRASLELGIGLNDEAMNAYFKEGMALETKQSR